MDPVVTITLIRPIEVMSGTVPADEERTKAGQSLDFCQRLSTVVIPTRISPPSGSFLYILDRKSVV